MLTPYFETPIASVLVCKLTTDHRLIVKCFKIIKKSCFFCCNRFDKMLTNCMGKECVIGIVDARWSNTFLGTLPPLWCYYIVGYLMDPCRVICNSFVEDNACTADIWLLSSDILWYFCYIVFTLEVSTDKLRMQAFIHLHMLGWMCSLFSVDLVRLMCLCKWKSTSVCGKIHFRGSYPCGKMNTAGSWLRQWDYQQWKHLVVRNGL